MVLIANKPAQKIIDYINSDASIKEIEQWTKLLSFARSMKKIDDYQIYLHDRYYQFVSVPIYDEKYCNFYIRRRFTRHERMY